MLTNWINQASEHWKDFQPTRYKALKRTGKLEKALQKAAKRTSEEMDQLMRAGYKHHEAWEVVKERYLFPPEEESLREDEAEELAKARPDLALLQKAVEGPQEETDDQETT